MSVIGSNILAGASGGAGDEALYVDDVYSTYAYEGNATARSINNGIDLNGEGGLVWIKNRDDADKSLLIDTERGESKALYSSEADAEVSTTGYAVTAFNSNGFSLAANSWSGENVSNEDIVSWTFRKAPGFFDVVTFQGTGSAQAIAHNLGCVPGFIVVKSLDSANPWRCYHSGIGNDYYLRLNEPNPKAQHENTWNQTDPTSTHFTVGSEADVNKNGDNFVAYLWADGSDSASAVFGEDSDEKIIKCGSYTGTSGIDDVDVGFEPQWILIKKHSTGNTHWVIYDAMREWNTSTDSHALHPNSTAVEYTGAGQILRTPTGFRGLSNDSIFGGGGDEYVYVAIRRPFKPAEAGTDVYEAGYATTGNNNNVKNTTSFPADLVWYNTNPVGGNSFQWFDRMRGSDRRLISSSNNGNMGATLALDYSDGFVNEFSTTTGYLYQAFKRAPSVFDIVHYRGNYQTSHQISHNLGVTPELMIIKNLDATDAWQIFANFGSSDYDRLLFTSDAATESESYGGTKRMAAQPTATNFTLGQVNLTNQNNEDYIAYLFSSLSGISKVGFYNGSSSDVDVDCGFTGGARFVLIKAHNVSGSWWVFDTTRGINSGVDPRLELNGNGAQDSTDDLIDPLDSGFRVVGGNTQINSTTGGAKFLFLAIA